MTKARILVVEDEMDVQELMILHLKREGNEATAVENGEDALKVLQGSATGFDLAVFDWMLPGISGLDLCKRFGGQMPILMVTARSDAADIVLGLEMGADDYITKPFEIPVFLARVRALLRRGRALKNGSEDLSRTTLRAGDLVLDLVAHHISCSGISVQLTASEFKLLAVLLKNQGRVLSREKLIEQVQGEDVNVTDRTVDTHVFGIRKKLGICGEFIETIRGVGYRLRAD